MYEDKELFSLGEQRIYTERHTQAAMLMGGIGTGCFAVGSRGQLQDFELFNRPSKGLNFPFTFFAVYAETAGRRDVRVLEAELQPPYAAPQGLLPGTVAGLPRFSHSRMEGRFPFASVELLDESFPCSVRLEAFNPFIPLNAEDSGIPAALLRYRVQNTGEEPCAVSVCGSLYNASGYDGVEMWGNFKNRGRPFNVMRAGDGFCGVFFANDATPPQDALYGTLGLTGRAGEVSAKPEWSMGQRVDGIHDFWDDFSSDGRLSAEPARMGTAGQLDAWVKIRIGSLALSRTLEPGEEGVFEFCLSWCFPNRVKAWPAVQGIGSPEPGGMTRNYYALKHPDAWAAAAYFWANLERLERESRLFSDAVFSSTLPPYVLDAATANLTVLKSTTCFRIENGHFFGFEGSLEDVGSCPGNCTHVWYYAQAMAYLFPELERNMRETDFLRETDEDGVMQFRALRELNGVSWDFIPAVDGQMGTIARLYREWKISGDDDFLRRLWPKAVAALECGIRLWDTDGDFVLDGCMHVDYDVEFYGVNPLGNLCYLAALRSAEEMARYLGDTGHAQRYHDIFSKASARADRLMWNGEYYEQVLEDVDACKYQHGKGVLSDQLMGQYYADLLGLGYLMQPDHIRTAAKNIFRYNFRENFYRHANMQRVYALYDDKGLLMTTWPHGGRPKFPFFYSEEVWSRTEYPLAAVLLYEGFLREGLTLVKAVRDRYDGVKRNPWNEFECGNHYAGIMASWALIPALSGFQVTLSKGEMQFDPKLNRENFRCFFSCGDGWGVYTRTEKDGKAEETVEYLYRAPTAR